MMAPEGERMRILDVAIRRATEELRAPIDRVEVAKGQVSCWAGSRRVLMTYDYAQGVHVDPVTGQFTPIVGGGHWDVAVIDGPGPRRAEIIKEALFRLLSLKPSSVRD